MTGYCLNYNEHKIFVSYNANMYTIYNVVCLDLEISIIP